MPFFRVPNGGFMTHVSKALRSGRLALSSMRHLTKSTTWSTSHSWTFALATARASSSQSTPTTVAAPASAQAQLSMPVPQPRSKTRLSKTSSCMCVMMAAPSSADVAYCSSSNFI